MLIATSRKRPAPRSHAAAQRDGGGSANLELLAFAARRQRRPHDGGSAWAGFAALDATVVERLLREEGNEAADHRASTVQAADATQQATARHVLGGECPGVTGADEAAHAAARTINAMQRLVAAAGGRASALMEQLTRAHGYASGSRVQRASAPDALWEAFNDVVAVDLCAPDWPLDGRGEREEERARHEMAEELAELAVKAGFMQHNCRRAWQRAAADEVDWRERQEAGREVLRVVLRAWREVCDDSRADVFGLSGAIAAGSGGVLAARLAFSVESQARRRRVEFGWDVRLLLEWVRLVRAGAVRAARQRAAQLQVAMPDTAPAAPRKRRRGPGGGSAPAECADGVGSDGGDGGDGGDSDCSDASASEGGESDAAHGAGDCGTARCARSRGGWRRGATVAGGALRNFDGYRVGGGRRHDATLAFSRSACARLRAALCFPCADGRLRYLREPRGEG